MTIKKYLLIGIGVFVLVVLLAVGITARFNLSEIASTPYEFVERFFNQWSPILAAAGTIILALSVFLFIYENRRHEERDSKQAIHALHDEILWNLNNIITLRFQISERLRYVEEHNMVPAEGDAPFELLDTRVFDDMRSRGQLHLLEDIRMEIIPCYKLIRDYNIDRHFKPNHLELLATLHEWLDKDIRDLEAKFKFLPRYLKEKGEGGETQTKNNVKEPQSQEQSSISECQKQGDNLLLQWIRKYSFPAFGIVAAIPIALMLFLAVSFIRNSEIELLLGLGFVFDTLAAGIALYVALFRGNRRWFILAIEFFVFGIFFKLFALL